MKSFIMSKLSFWNFNMTLMLFYFKSTTSNIYTISNRFQEEETFRIRLNYCIYNRDHNITQKFDSNTNSHFDTLTQDDIVKQQYALLPYPAVKPGEFERVRWHYKSDRKDVPIMIAPPVTLENINHFLYQGRNNFR